ncbi:MAG: MtrB/PioB family decaheme-associated outer membrane protein [Candidatus Aminicenantia bacterium]
MKKIKIILLIIGLALLNSFALTEEKEETKVSGKMVTGAQDIQVDSKSSKFFEYRDVPRGFTFGRFDINVEKGNRYLNLNFSNLRQKDGRYEINFGEYGKFDINFLWDKTPHRFSFDGKTLYVGREEGGVYYYTISDQIQTDAQNAPTITDTRKIISNFLTGAYSTGLELIRNKGVIDIKYSPSVPFSFNLKAQREKREGLRPIGASFGFSHVVEVPEPINYETTNVDFNAEYSKRWGTFLAGFHYSNFENNFKTLVWDNPFRIKDNPGGSYINGDSSAFGRMALSPSNSAQQFYFRGSIKAIKNTRINASISFGTFNQNEKLLPYTINTVLTSYYSGALNPPAESANAKADVTTIDFNINTRIIKNFYLSAGYNSYEFNNKTHELHLPGYSRFDQAWEPAVDVEPYSFISKKYYGDITFNFLKRTSLKAGFSSSSIERELGEEDEGKSEETLYHASIDTNPTDWLLLRFSYINSSREWSLDGIKKIYPTFNFKRYHEATREREGLNLLASVSPLQNLDISVSYMQGKDDYPKSDYGLRSEDFKIYSFDLSYAFKKESSLYAFYSDEEYKGSQKSRQSLITYSTDLRDDWSADLKDKVDSYGVGLNFALKKDKLNLDLSYVYSKADGTSFLDSPPGRTAGPDLAVNFAKKIDTFSLQAIKTKLLWKLQSRVTLALGYWYEQYDLEDITRNDLKVDMLLTGFGIYLGALEPAYKYHVGFIKLIYSF